MSNPAAVRQFLDTGGQSLWRGFKNYLADLAENGGLPAQVDKSPFKLGVNIATTPGAVVFRNEVLEVIQYRRTQPKCASVPVVVTPPQINKFYSLDLSPDKSLVQYLLKSGIQVFCVSWRNPTAKERDWGLDTYVEALDEGTDAVRDITALRRRDDDGRVSAGSPRPPMPAGSRPRAKQKSRILSRRSAYSTWRARATARSARSGDAGDAAPAKESSRLRGVLDGQDLARMFAWMRPNDLIWNYWVNNYLMGNQPPAFDILFWNADTTSLPARLHHDYVDMFSTNPFVNANKLVLDGVALDMRRVKLDAYVVAGVTDHITPWKAVYRRPRSSATKPRSSVRAAAIGRAFSIRQQPKSVVRRRHGEGAGRRAFAASAEKKSGSWWPHWRDCFERSGAEVVAGKPWQQSSSPRRGCARILCLLTDARSHWQARVGSHA